MGVQQEPQLTTGTLVVQLNAISASDVPVRRDRIRVVLKYGKSTVGKWSAHEVVYLRRSSL